MLIWIVFIHGFVALCLCGAILFPRQCKRVAAWAPVAWGLAHPAVSAAAAFVLLIPPLVALLVRFAGL